MWVVLKYKNNELNFLKEDLKKKLGQQPEIYQPKIKLQRFLVQPAKKSYRTKNCNNDSI